MSRAASALLAALISASCGVPLMKLPSGPGAVAPDAPNALAQATAACRAVKTITAEIAVSGSVNGRRLRVRLFAGLASPASARLEAVAAFGPIFIFVAQRSDATLLLPHDDRVLEHGNPSMILEAIAGLPLDAADLVTTLVGCDSAGNSGNARQLGDDWILVPEPIGDVYLHRTSQTAPWRLVAAVHRGGAAGEWRAEYRDFRDGLPQAIRLMSVGSRRFDLRLALSQVEVNPPLGDDAFRVRIPPAAVPISLSELRESGLLAGTSSNGR